MKVSLKDRRHSLAHVMTLAVRRLFDDNILRGVGPAIDNGFYQDFDYKFSDDDLAMIEDEMRKIIKEDFEFVREESTIDKAVKYYEDLNQVYKLELLKDIKEKGSSKVSDEEEDEETAKLSKEGIVKFYTIDTHKDLCRGGHVNKTGELKDMGFKIDRLAGAYWRGNEKNKMLTRIYGVAFESQSELDDYYNKLEEAKKRDHRILGKDLKMFMFSEMVGPGLPMYLPNGGVVVSEIERFLRFVQGRLGYHHVYSPHIALEKLYQTSGHINWYRESMYPGMEFEGEDYFLKPMSCPHHVQMYKSDKRSYRELPLKLAEFGGVYRYEKSGQLGGLLRARGFTQDDAHIFLRKDQVVEVFMETVDLLNELLDGLGLMNRKYRLSLKDDSKDKYAGNDEEWSSATEMIREALRNKNIEYFEAPGEAAFYGPKLDVIFNDSLDREWQISTVQVDFLQPQRFDLEYVDDQGKIQRPMMIHRAPLGSRERIVAILLEHFAGNFPTWLAPTQIKILPINDACIEYGKKVEKLIKDEGYKYEINLRVEVDVRKENLQKKIADSSEMKVPYILVCGKREEEKNEVAVRVRGKGDIGAMQIDKFVENFIKEVRERSLNSKF